MDRVYDVTIREVREKIVAVKASSKEEAEKGCRMYGPSTSERHLKSKSEKVTPSANPSQHIPRKKR